MHTSVSIPTRTTVLALVIRTAAAIAGLSAAPKTVLSNRAAAPTARATSGSVGPLVTASSSVTTTGTRSAVASPATRPPCREPRASAHGPRPTGSAP